MIRSVEAKYIGPGRDCTEILASAVYTEGARSRVAMILKIFLPGFPVQVAIVLSPEVIETDNVL